MTSTEIIYDLCQPCAVAVMYADESGLTEYLAQAVQEFIEDVGVVAYVGPINEDEPAGECEACGNLDTTQQVSPLH